MPELRERYPRVYHFRVDFGLTGTVAEDSHFREVAGLSMELETETVAEGGENRFSHKVPVRGTAPDLVLKRGLIADSTVIAWIKDAVHSMIIRPTSVNITLTDPTGNPLRVFTCVNAWPKKWTISDLSAETSDIAVETLDLCYAHMREV